MPGRFWATCRTNTDTLVLETGTGSGADLVSQELSCLEILAKGRPWSGNWMKCRRRRRRRRRPNLFTWNRKQIRFPKLCVRFLYSETTDDGQNSKSELISAWCTFVSSIQNLNMASLFAQFCLLWYHNFDDGHGVGLWNICVFDSPDTTVLPFTLQEIRRTCVYGSTLKAMERIRICDKRFGDLRCVRACMRKESRLFVTVKQKYPLLFRQQILVGQLRKHIYDISKRHSRLVDVGL